MKVSVLIITYQRTHLLEKCLKSLREQEFHHYTLETLIFVNGEDQDSLQVASQDPSNPSVIKSPNRLSPAEARNELIEKANGEYILFLDDDVELPRDYLEKSQAYTSSSKACFGGPDILPKRPSAFQEILSASQKLWMSSAHTRYRHGAKTTGHKTKNSGEKLILCNMWIKKEVFEKYHLRFDPRFFRNEENVLIHQLLENELECLFAPELYVHHYKKDHLTGALKAISSSARHRALSFRYYPKSVKIVYFVPSLFVIFLMVGPWLAPQFTAGVLALYFTLGFIDIFVNIYREGSPLNICLGAWGMQILTNMTYGLGFLRGLLKLSR